LTTDSCSENVIFEIRFFAFYLLRSHLITAPLDPLFVIGPHRVRGVAAALQGGIDKLYFRLENA